MNLSPLLTPLLPAIRLRADDLDQSGAWPEEDLASLAHAGLLRAAAPASAGGAGLSPLELSFGYEAIASASLAVALILSQRDSAVGLIAGAASSLALATLLRLAGNDIFATVGIAQLTTSRQGATPALRATPAGEGYRVDGLIPWSTGAGRSQFIVTGAALDDGQQILFLLPTDRIGVVVEPSLPLVALRASWTAQVRCEGVLIHREELLGAPAAKVLGSRTNALPLGQAFLAMGLCRGGLDLIQSHTSALARTARARLHARLTGLRTEILELSTPGREPEAVAAGPRLRGACNELALRIGHTAITLYKGTALLAGHPAQRIAREAMFLLVWSCPNPVIDCTVDQLTEVRSRDA